MVMERTYGEDDRFEQDSPASWCPKETKETRLYRTKKDHKSRAAIHVERGRFAQKSSDYRLFFAEKRRIGK
jgi:hypothetical protein